MAPATLLKFSAAMATLSCSPSPARPCPPSTFRAAVLLWLYPKTMKAMIMSNNWSATILTLFPNMFPGPLGTSLAGKALKENLWSLEVRDIRDHGLGKHRNVDD